MIRDNSNLDISCILLDLQKDFDTINHEFLLYKLEAYGVRGVCLDWFTSYLRKRSQCVSINGKVSKPLLIDCGVPQGSILGPLLFIIYVNDFRTRVKTLFRFSLRMMLIAFTRDPKMRHLHYKMKLNTFLDGWL